MSEDAHERDLENVLVTHMSHFLLEMGRGFAFVGRQVHFEQGGKDYYIDLLLYHLKLHRFIVLELKIGDFRPEYTGKMSFDLSMIDDKLRTEDDKPSIGLILCKNKNNVTVEYALRDFHKPIGVADYEVNFTNAIPESLKGDLPTIEDLEKELQKDVQVLQKPIDEKIEKLKTFVTSLGKPEMQKVDPQDIKDDLFTYTLMDLQHRSKIVLKEINALFQESWIAPMCNGNIYKKMDQQDILGEFQMELENKIIGTIGLYASFNGFKFGGANAFTTNFTLTFSFDNFKYLVGPVNPRKEFWVEKTYDEPWTEIELDGLADRWAEWMIDRINENISRTK